MPGAGEAPWNPAVILTAGGAGNDYFATRRNAVFFVAELT
jgi:hypothetical protein